MADLQAFLPQLWLKLSLSGNGWVGGYGMRGGRLSVQLNRSEAWAGAGGYAELGNKIRLKLHTLA